ncbi:aldose epimerase family protein [Limosilactobacillus secaliphilus]|uniref:Maltose epimerase n=1 Tax=Limosilactobacillus secaliphilus TaxID=396268 RepID=A0A0R2I087_9LACO|nr:aldose epimerase family protein [Limosilactobacillus secaliphilus]KRN58392.1 galactose mutarotase [Limosilactobacillus secaliphilus]
MEVSHTNFGSCQERDVIKYTLTNDHGVSISVLNYGGIWQAYTVPTDKGSQNLLLSANSIDDYLDAGYAIGQTIGPVANRIAAAQFVIDGHDYQLTPNEGPNLIHGGNRSWRKQFWAVATEVTDGVGKIILHRRFTPVDDGFPDNRLVHVVFSLHADDSVNIDYYAETDQPTLFNPTNHTYWNLGDSDAATIEDQHLQLNSDYHLAVGQGKIPTGQFLANVRTPYDFNRGARLGDALNKMLTTPEKGFDDYFVVRPSNTFEGEPIAVMSDPKSGRQMKMYSDRNSLVVFSADGLPSSVKLNRPGRSWAALALEAQSLTDAIHHPSFGDIVLRPAEPKHYQVRYEIKY